METFGGILALIAIVAFGVGLVGLIVALIRKSDKMPWLYTVASGAGVMTLAIVLVGLSQGSTENQDTATISSLKAANNSLKTTNSSLSSAVEDKDEEDENDYSYNDSSDSGESETETFNFGEPVEFESGAKVTVNSAKDDPSIDLMEAKPGESGVAVNVTVENTGSSPLDFNAQNFDLYDGADVNANFDAESYGNNIPDSIAAGKKTTFTMYFDIATKGKYSVTYGDAIWEQQ